MRTRNTSKQRIMYKAIHAWEVSGISIRSYCKLHGYSYESFRFWKKKLKHYDSKGRFIPLTVSDEIKNISITASEIDVIKITRPGGIRIECPQTVSLNVLQTLIAQ